MSRRSGHGVRPLVLAGVVWLAWVAIAVWLGPWMLAAAYAERSLPFLNDALSGRTVHGLDRYVSLWQALAVRGTVVLGVVTAVAVVIGMQRRRLGALLGPVARATMVPSGVGWAGTVLLAVWMGMAVGLAETLRAGIAFRLQELPTSEFHPDLIWMIPLANVVTLCVLAVLLAGLAVLVSGRRGLALVPSLVGFVGAYAAVRAVGGVHPAAATVLAIGLVLAVMRGVLRSPERARLLVRRSGIVMAVSLLGFAGMLRIGDRVREARLMVDLPAAQAGALNVLLIILDTVRAPSLSVMGYERPTTPNLERLATRGVVFERAWATAPWTLPSHASMFTGRDATQLSADYLEPLNGEHPTLAEALSAQGYVGGGFVSNYFFASRASGLARGFVHYSDYPLNADAISGSAWLPRRLRRRWNALRDDYRRLTHKTAERVNSDFLAWLPRTEGRPFFAFLNYLDAHEPYDAPEPFPRRFARPGTRYWFGYNRPYSEAELSELRDHYDDAIAYMDHQIGRLLETLDARGVLRNTLVIVASDHGEEFGVHAPELVKHGWSLYSPALHVPLLLSLPGHVPEGLRIASPVSIASIPATVLGLLPGADPTRLPGRSLARFWSQADTTGDTIVSRASTNPRETPPDDVPIAEGPLHSIVSGNLHYILNGDGDEELYDIVVDPLELTDLSEVARFGQALERLRSELRQRADSLPSIPRPPF